MTFREEVKDKEDTLKKMLRGLKDEDLTVHHLPLKILLPILSSLQQRKQKGSRSQWSSGRRTG